MAYKSLVVVLCLALSKGLLAQHCPWDRRGALLLDIRDEKTKEPVQGLTVHLVDSAATDPLNQGYQNFFQLYYSPEQSQPALYAKLNQYYTLAVKGKGEALIQIEDKRITADSNKYKPIRMPLTGMRYHLCVSRFPQLVNSITPEIIYLSKK